MARKSKVFKLSHDQVSYLIKHWETHSLGSMAEKLGATRNQVCSFGNRLRKELPDYGICQRKLTSCISTKKYSDGSVYRLTEEGVYVKVSD